LSQHENSNFNLAQAALDKEVTSAVDMSVALLIAIKSGQSTEQLTKQLESITRETLKSELQTDAQKLAFWINIYNAYIQLKLTERPEYYEDRRGFFKKKFIPLAGENMSFADIEHGIIRRSQFEYFMGYLRNPFVKKYKKILRPKKGDYRIHFALNCGAKSCPPVGIYHPDTLDKQLDEMARRFLKNFSTYDVESNEVMTTPLFSWFRGDFKGKKGIKKILHENGIIPDVNVNLKFDKYDWTLALDNFVD